MYDWVMQISQKLCIMAQHHNVIKFSILFYAPTTIISPAICISLIQFPSFGKTLENKYSFRNDSVSVYGLGLVSVALK